VLVAVAAAVRGDDLVGLRRIRLVVQLELLEPEVGAVVGAHGQALEVVLIDVARALHDQHGRLDVDDLDPLRPGDEGDGALFADDAVLVAKDPQAGRVVDDRRLAGLDLDHAEAAAEQPVDHQQAGDRG